MRRCFCYLLCLWPHLGFAQQPCEGSLGSNLFEKGDFGFGTETILSTDPQIAPGYNYIFVGPPDDGEYLITNNVRDWNFVYDTWLVIGDNSPDSRGYMMVVNASFEPGLFYEEIITDICENTQFQFSADVINMVRRNVPNHIRPNVAFLIDDKVVLQTGDIQQDERWHTYFFNFTTLPGQTSVKLSLRNNAPGGIGNDLALDNIAFKACGPPAKVDAIGISNTLCTEELPYSIKALVNNKEDKNNFYLWQGSQDSLGPWNDIPNSNGSNLTLRDTEVGINYYRFGFAGSAANFENEKCRFFSDYSAVHIPQRDFEVYDTICGGTGISIAGLDIGEPGVYLDRLVSSMGCDSIITYFIDTIRRQTISADLVYVDPLCSGEASGIVYAENISQGYPPYLINVNGIDQEGISYSALQSGNHIIEVKDKYGCFYEENILLEDPEEFIINAGGDLEILLGEEITIDIQANQTIKSISLHYGNDSISGNTTISLLPLSGGALSVKAFSEDGCQANDLLNISVDEDVSIYLPNAFSPNGDGKNDYYSISAVGKSIANIEVFDIYSRWGEKVASLANSDGLNRWDGLSMNGHFYNPGIYTVRVVAILINGVRIEKTSTISLIR